MIKATPPKTIDQYIATFPTEVQEILQKIRHTIKQSAPSATEAISYQIPTFKLSGNLVHFGAFKHHISFFPSSSPIPVFAQELAPYETSKGTIKFPIGQPIPYTLIQKIVAFRVQENLAKVSKK